MNPILMNLSSVQSLTHDRRTRFASRFVDLSDGVDVHRERPSDVFARLAAWVVGGHSPKHQAGGALAIRDKEQLRRIDGPAQQGLIVVDL